MSEFSVPNLCQPKKPWFACLIMSDLASFFACIHSYPYNYFFCLILISPLFLRLPSFLFPLLITATILLAFLTISLNKNQEIFLYGFKTILEKLKSKGNNESGQDFSQLEELEAYKLLFETCTHEVEGLDVKEDEKIVHAIESTVEEYSRESGNINFDDIPYGTAFEPNVKGNSSKEGKQEKDNFDDGVLDMKVHKVDEEETLPMSEESKAVGNTVISPVNDKKLPLKVEEKNIQKLGTYFDCNDDFLVNEPNSIKEKSRKLETKLSVNNKGDETKGNSSPNLESSGSVRREKVWRKTLACKIFEERHNVHADISEGMDMLWETYESESMNVGEVNAKQGAKFEIHTEFDEDVEEDVEDDGDVQLCCMQALKFSSGKVNLGMKSPSLRKISKAFKGIGWLHRVCRHGKKVHHST